MNMSIIPTKHPHRLEVVVPVLDRSGVRVERSARMAVVRKIKTAMSDWAGGFTVYVGHGGWVTPTGEVMDEPVSLLVAYGQSVVPLGLLNELVELIMVQLNQEAVAIISDGALLLYGREFVENGEAAS